MSISIKRCRTGIGVLVLLLLAVGRLAAQTSSTGVNAIPQQTVTTGQNRLAAKTNTVTNQAADKVDTLGTKAYKGMINLFKKKKKTPPAAGAAPPAGTTPPPGGTPPPPGAGSTPPPPGSTPPPPGGTPPPPGADTTHKHG